VNPFIGIEATICFPSKMFSSCEEQISSVPLVIPDKTDLIPALVKLDAAFPACCVVAKLLLLLCLATPRRSAVAVCIVIDPLPPVIASLHYCIGAIVAVVTHNNLLGPVVVVASSLPALSYLLPLPNTMTVSLSLPLSFFSTTSSSLQ
jgi:hypothetical protein